MVNPLVETFPGLARGGYTITSPSTNSYNCIAWAAGDTANWWWPTLEAGEVFWPSDVVRAETLPAFRQAFASFGYSECSSEDLETGFEKIAVFANDQGVPLHAARQLSDGRWTSKLGELEDIEHALHDLKGEVYGSVVLVMKRPLPSRAGATTEREDG
jgi:hypothetical protein